jgi:hypothetical protein
MSFNLCNANNKRNKWKSWIMANNAHSKKLHQLLRENGAEPQWKRGRSYDGVTMGKGWSHTGKKGRNHNGKRGGAILEKKGGTTMEKGAEPYKRRRAALMRKVGAESHSQ